MLHAPTSRRQFLFTSGKAAIGVGIGLRGLTWFTGCAPETPTDPSGIWKELEASLTGELFQPGSFGYFEMAKPWALQYTTVLPSGIARCANEQDVQACVQWARKHSIDIVARSGGHSYAAYSMTSGLLVDVTLMNTVTLEPTTNIAVVGGGARNKHVYAALREPRLAVTHGRCKEVGVAGLVLGGGIGFNMRAHGLTCDRLRSTRIVTADGNVLTCSETENPDLFWAIRGAGGGNYGIHTQFTFEPFPVTDITVFTISWDTKLEEVFAAIQQIILAAPNTLGVKVSITATPSGGSRLLRVEIIGQLVGSPAELDALLQPVYAIANPVLNAVQQLPYWDGQEVISEEGAPEYSHERSRFAFTALSPDAISTIFRNMYAWPITGVGGTWKYFLMGGAINDKQPQDTAFVHRNATMITSIELEWLASDVGEVLQAALVWLDVFHNEMQQYTSDQSYQNFIDRRQVGYLDAYYSTNLPRLMQIKRQVDPTNMFKYAQSIPIA